MFRELFPYVGLIVIFALIGVCILQKIYLDMPDEDEDEEENYDNFSFKELFGMIFH